MTSKQMPSRHRHSLPVTSSDFAIARKMLLFNDERMDSLVANGPNNYVTRSQKRSTQLHVHFADDTKFDREVSEDDEEPSELPTNYEIDEIKTRIYKSRLKKKIWPHYQSDKILEQEPKQKQRTWGANYAHGWSPNRRRELSSVLHGQAQRQRLKTYPCESSDSLISLALQREKLTFTFASKDAFNNHDQSVVNGYRNLEISDGHVNVSARSKHRTSQTGSLEDSRKQQGVNALTNVDVAHPFQGFMVTNKSGPRKDDLKNLGRKPTDSARHINKELTATTYSRRKDISLKVQEFLTGPQPKASFPSLRVESKSTIGLQPTRRKQNRQERPQLPKQGRSIPGVPVNPDTCPQISHFMDIKKWLYQDKTGRCRYLREPESPIPAVLPFSRS